ncbi:hypothetical protein GCM10025867_08360 [Frondihabitans sucicola]|uniref:Uncharacterized protein n=1 Tax=Frondihabitans sucicola TaxID=1268041 RepID=A0ABN6XUA4_9MICO|nr:hypothetical protein [Frondihabitans sucicola]BDZ48595.1 hypothetical protein GCM10025867_08360 [Frondihabitans sucicola]
MVGGGIDETLRRDSGTDRRGALFGVDEAVVQAAGVDEHGVLGACDGTVPGCLHGDPVSVSGGEVEGGGHVGCVFDKDDERGVERYRRVPRRCIEIAGFAGWENAAADLGSEFVDLSVQKSCVGSCHASTLERCMVKRKSKIGNR